MSSTHCPPSISNCLDTFWRTCQTTVHFRNLLARFRGDEGAEPLLSSDAPVHTARLGRRNPGPLTYSNIDDRLWNEQPYRLPPKFAQIQLQDGELKQSARNILGVHYGRLIPSTLLALATAFSYWMVAYKEDVNPQTTYITSFVNLIFYVALYPPGILAIQRAFQSLPLLYDFQKNDLSEGRYKSGRIFLRTIFFLLHASVYISFFIIAAVNALPILLALLRERKTQEITCFLQPGSFQVQENGLSPCWINQFSSLMLVFAEGFTASPEMIEKVWKNLLLLIQRTVLDKAIIDNHKYVVGKSALLAQLHAQHQALEAAIKDAIRFSDLSFLNPLPQIRHNLVAQRNQGTEKIMLVLAQNYYDDTDLGKKGSKTILKILSFLNHYIFGYGGSILLNFSFSVAAFVALSQTLPALLVELVGNNFFSSGLMGILKVPAWGQVALITLGLLPDIYLLGKLASKFFPEFINSFQNIRAERSYLKKFLGGVFLFGSVVLCLYSVIGLVTGTHESIHIALMDSHNTTITQNEIFRILIKTIYAIKLSNNNPFADKLYLGTLTTMVTGTVLNAYTFLSLYNAVVELGNRAMQRFPLVNRPTDKAQNNRILAGKLILDLYAHIIHLLESPFCKIRPAHALLKPLNAKHDSEAQDAFNQSLTDNLEAHFERHVRLDTYTRDLIQLIDHTLGELATDKNDALPHGGAYRTASVTRRERPAYQGVILSDDHHDLAYEA